MALLSPSNPYLCLSSSHVHSLFLILNWADLLRISQCASWTTARVKRSSFLGLGYELIYGSNTRRKAFERWAPSAIYPPCTGDHPSISLDISYRHMDSRLPCKLNDSSICSNFIKVFQLFELLTERQLFDQDTENYSDHLHLQYIVECLGPFPPSFLDECKDRGKYFDEKGTNAFAFEWNLLPDDLTTWRRRSPSKERRIRS